MRSTFIAGVLLSGALFVQTPAVAADEHGSCDEAKAMAEKAVAYYKANGSDKAWETFLAKPPEFWDRDLYVFAFQKDGTYKVHAAKPVLVGKNAIDMKDVTGFPLIKAIVEVKQAEWVAYKYPDPSDNNKVKDKKSWVTPVDDYVIGVGCYGQ
jgi:signal transduction histidine kinase